MEHIRPSEAALKKAFAKMQIATIRLIKEGKFDDVLQKRKEA